MSAAKSETFAARLQREMDAAGLSVGQLAARLGISYQAVEKQLNRASDPSADVQARYLAACRAPAPDIAALIALFEADMKERLVALTHDLETLTSARAVTPAAASEAVALARPARRRAAT